MFRCLKALDVCAEGFWIRDNFFYEVRWLEGHRICKISLVNLHTELITDILSPLEGNNKSRKTDTHTVRLYTFCTFINTLLQVEN